MWDGATVLVRPERGLCAEVVEEPVSFDAARPRVLEPGGSELLAIDLEGGTRALGI